MIYYPWILRMGLCLHSEREVCGKGLVGTEYVPDMA